MQYKLVQEGSNYTAEARQLIFLHCKIQLTEKCG